MAKELESWRPADYSSGSIFCEFDQWIGARKSRVNREQLRLL
jgi:hypothetical protein